MSLKKLLDFANKKGVRGSSIEYRGELDGIRGIAITAVVLNHIGLLPLGGWAVDLFFLLSGYLITKILIASSSKSDILKVFYIRRFARLAPAAIIFLIYSTVVLILEQEQFSQKVLFSAFFYYRNFFEFEAGPLGHFWTLSAEEQFYVLWPITLLFFLRATRLRSLQYISFGVCLTLVLLGQLIVISDPKINFAFQHVLVRPSILLAGCAIAIFETRNRISSKIKFSNISLILGLMLFGWEFFSSGDIWVFGILLIGASQLIDRGNSRNLLAKALKIWPLPQLGLLSYSMYIWHFESIRIAHQLSPDSQIIQGVVLVALLLLFSIVSFNFIEKPAQRFIVARFSPMISNSKKE